MTKEAMHFIDEAMMRAGIPYEFMEYTSDVSLVSAYWTGEYSESPPEAEDGSQETQFTLNGFGKGRWLELEQQKEKIKQLFPMNRGKTAILDNGSGVAVFYENAFPIPTGDAFLKRLQINLKIKEWKVD